MKLYPCASSSRGNMYLITHGKDYIVVDAGIAGSNIYNYCKEYGGPFSKFKGFFITHNHGDHCSGLDVFTKKYKKVMPTTPYHLYAHPKTNTLLTYKNASLSPFCKDMETGQEITIGDLKIRSFSLPHDVPCHGFIISVGDEKLAICTDLGFMPPPILDLLQGVDMIVLEANYDPQSLSNNTKYSFSEKERIGGQWGHLCNGESAWVVGNLLDSGLKTVIFAHLSAENNTEEMVTEALHYELQQNHKGKSVTAYFAPRKSPDCAYDVKTGEVTAL